MNRPILELNNLFVDFRYFAFIWDFNVFGQKV